MIHGTQTATARILRERENVTVQLVILEQIRDYSDNRARVATVTLREAVQQCLWDWYGVNQLQEDQRSQQLEQMGSMDSLSRGGNSSNRSNPFVTPAKPPTANTATNTIEKRPQKRQKIQFSFSFTKFAEKQSKMTRTSGVNRLDLGLAKAES